MSTWAVFLGNIHRGRKMSLLDRLTSLFDRNRQQLTSFAIEPSQTDNHPQPVALEAGKTYFRLRVCQMYLSKEVQAARSWYPAVHSLVRFQFGDQPAVEIP